MEAWTKEIKIEDIPDAYQHLARILGIEALIKLSNISGGTMIYVPKIESLFQVARDRLIVKEFNGGNYKELARKYNLTESWVRRLIQQDHMAKNQATLF